MISVRGRATRRGVEEIPSCRFEEGRPAPPFTLEDTSGKTVTLADLRGKDVILYFYPRDETPGCTKEACGFRDLWKDIRAEGVEILGVSPDGRESHQKFAANHRLPFRLLSDPSKKMMTSYDAFGEKMMYGKKVQGVIRSTVWIGPDGKVKKHWKQGRERRRPSGAGARGRARRLTGTLACVGGTAAGAAARYEPRLACHQSS